MYNFVLQVITILSLSVIVLFVTRALPRVAEEEKSKTARKVNLFDRTAKRIPLDKLDAHAHSFLEKSLRKLKVLLMKTDNFVDDRISRVKKSKNGKSEERSIREHVDMIAEEKNGEKEIKKGNDN